MKELTFRARTFAPEPASPPKTKKIFKVSKSYPEGTTREERLRLYKNAWQNANRKSRAKPKPIRPASPSRESTPERATPDVSQRAPVRSSKKYWELSQW